MCKRILTLVFFLVFSVLARAQFSNALPPAGDVSAVTFLTAGVEGNLPVGRFGQMASGGLGVEAKAWLIGAGRGATLVVGVRRFAGKGPGGVESPSITLVSLKAGYLLFFPTTFLRSRSWGIPPAGVAATGLPMLLAWAVCWANAAS